MAECLPITSKALGPIPSNTHTTITKIKKLMFKAVTTTLKEGGANFEFTKTSPPAAFSSYLREVIKVLRAGLGPHCHPVHLIVEPIQEEAKELLSILLTEPRESE